MNHESFHNANGRVAGCGRRFLLGLRAGCSRALQLFDRGGEMPTERIVSMQKRELEDKLLAAGYSRRLAKIAVAEAFAPNAASPD